MSEFPEALLDFRERVRQGACLQPEMPAQLVVLSRLFGYVYMRLEAAYDTLMARWDLTAWSWFTLMVVYSRHGEEVTPSDISRVLFLARANVTRLTDDLVRRGLLHREPSTQDRRVLRLSLTDAGTALVTDTMPHAWAMHRSIWSEFSEQQLADAEVLFCNLLSGLDRWPAADLPCVAPPLSSPESA